MFFFFFHCIKFTDLLNIICFIAHLGNSMSKVREKRSTSKSRQFLWVGPFLNNFWNFWVFLAQNKKFTKRTVLKKWKFKAFFSKIQQLISNIIYIIPIVWFLRFCRFVLLFAMFRPFFTVLVIARFFLILWKMRFSKYQAAFEVTILQLNKTSYQIKSPGLLL